ncbi:MAG: hypothetical protein DME21_01620 [Verrucomicrobia bacterium]|nr:MAG: hypothetical protein DME21_01620 [Verrucomicrobiota bacterium]
MGALRDSVMKSAAAQWDEKIEIGVGPITLYLARAGLAFVDLDPEARTALHAVRGAEVGVYKLREGHEQLKRAVILSAADKAMATRGWDRLVGVMNQGEFVAIYVRHDARSTRNVRVCLLTLSRGEMVVASARSNLEPLMEIAFKRAEWHQKGRAPIHFWFPPLAPVELRGRKYSARATDFFSCIWRVSRLHSQRSDQVDRQGIVGERGTRDFEDMDTSPNERGANGRQPFCSECFRASAVAAYRG